MGIYYSLVGCMLLSYILPYCYAATIILQSVQMNADRVYESLWFRLSAKRQRYLVLLIQYAQREREIKGYGYISCSMPTVLRVKPFKMKYSREKHFDLFSDYSNGVFHIFAVQRISKCLISCNEFLFFILHSKRANSHKKNIFSMMHYLLNFMINKNEENILHFLRQFIVFSRIKIYSMR